MDLSQVPTRKLNTGALMPAFGLGTFGSDHVSADEVAEAVKGPAHLHLVYALLFWLALHRRRVIHFNVIAHPTSEWTARQVAEAYPWDSAPRYMLHDRDSIYGDCFREPI